MNDVRAGLLNNALGTPGKVAFIQVNVTAAGAVTFAPNKVQGIGNAFIILDSPIALAIQATGPATNRIYNPNTGEAFPVPIGFMSFAAPGTLSLLGAGAYSFTIKIWTGPQKALGLIDHRNGAEPTSLEYLYPYAVGTPLWTVPAGNTAATGVGPGDMLNPTNFGGNTNVTGLLIGNISPNTTLFITTGGATSSYVAPLFPQTLTRLPWLQSLMGTAPVIAIANPAGTSAQVTLAWIMRTSNYQLNLGP